MKKSVISLGFAALVVSTSSLAAPIGGLGGNFFDTVKAVLADPVGVSGNLLGALPKAGSQTIGGVGNIVQALPAVLAGGPITKTTTTASLPLPGPGFLNANLELIPGLAGVDVKTGGGSYDLTFTTGQ